MLRLFYGRESLDKDRFLFDGVKASLEKLSPGEKILLIVPDQFTLQAEQNAFAYLGVSGLMDLEILSQTRLGHRVLSEAGGSTRLHIDRYGRHMVIARILSQLEGELTAFHRVKKSPSFVEMVNDFLIEIKQNNVDPQRLSEILEGMEEDSLIYRKLWDIKNIFEKYEEALEGRYIDTEDYMALFTSKIPQASLILKSQIWIWGFDSFTAKSMQMIRALMNSAVSVNIIMTGDGETEGRDRELFQLTEGLLYRLSHMAEEDGVLWEAQQIPRDYRFAIPQRKAPQLAHLERELYAWPYQPYSAESERKGMDTKDDAEKEKDGDRESRQEAVGFCRASNLYTEVETAAARIVELTRDRGMKYGDIAVICNDLERYGSVIKRVFRRYDIPVFLDEKRTVLHNPAIELLISLLDIVTKGWQTADVFRFLKTGLCGMEAEEYEELENYAIKYRIKGRRWKADLQYGKGEYGEEGLIELNQRRLRLAQPLAAFEKEFHQGETAREKSVALYRMLSDTLQLPHQLERLLARLVEEEELLAAEEIGQIWEVIVGLLDQIVELLGDTAITDEDYISMFQAGISAVEIGLLPPTMDQIIVGTMQRTRRGRIRGLLVIGANDGVIPAAGDEENLLSEVEKNLLWEQNIVLCKNDDYRACEEQLAIYKNLSKPEEYLWMSYSVTDLEGREKKPSLIFEKLTEIFPQSVLQKDIVNAEQDIRRIQTRDAAALHMSQVFRRRLEEDAEISTAWKAAYNEIGGIREEGAFSDQEISVDGTSEKRLSEAAARLCRGLFFTNEVKRLDQEIVSKLYKKDGLRDLILSPSRLERFGKCPFSHFVQYGLKPEERRVFQVAAREVGDVYHQCLMELSQQLTVPGADVTGQGSPWMQISEEECRRRVDEIMDAISQEYREGVLQQGKEEQYRSRRMKKIAGDAAWAMISHVRQGTIRKVYFEAGFGKGKEKPFPPIVVETAGQKIRIEGKIDRVDVLGENTGRGGKPAGSSAGESDVAEESAGPSVERSYVKIVDYKSGVERFDLEEAREGVRLQLMLYLEGAMGGVKESKPAGVFYFEIAEPMIDASGLSREELGERVAEQIKKSFKMDGVMVDEPAVVEGIAGEFTGYSDVAPLRKGTKGVSGTAEGKLLSPEDFESFRREVYSVIERLCCELAQGEAGIYPKRMKTQDPCKYCPFKGVCFFDPRFEGCGYR